MKVMQDNSDVITTDNDLSLKNQKTYENDLQRNYTCDSSNTSNSKHNLFLKDKLKETSDS